MGYRPPYINRQTPIETLPSLIFRTRAVKISRTSLCKVLKSETDKPILNSSATKVMEPHPRGSQIKPLQEETFDANNVHYFV